MANATCSRCGRIVPDSDHFSHDGRAYHELCLPRKARAGYAPEPKKQPFTIRLYNRLAFLVQENKITPLEKVLGALAVEFNTNAGYLGYVIKQLEAAGCVERKFDVLTLIKAPQVGSKEELAEPNPADKAEGL